ncbi:cell division protein FtsI (penicillin-binding protein 3) [Saccharicrinis carchari]|uniref:Cell division protein FtsI (Penicillin-binding protein 3) n=1 Tax=Saccharicrinis carchari TaxID=1168039 RepID=A0A521C3Y3_SACCC|nr:penicillin-binding protein [Saccharicrinis carchari]SMO54196.1 cell division protein FtsI (penicillin-binding protein 3) [Saccharicrinis carchari]
MTIKRDITWRVGVIYLALVMLAAYVIVKVVYLQVAEGSEWRAMEAKMTSKEREIEANRGNILACDGRKLACSVPSYRLYMDVVADGLTDEVFYQNIDSLSYCLSVFFKDLSPKGYKRRLVEARRKKSRYFRIHNRRVSYTELKKIKQFPLFRLGKNKGGFIPEQLDMRKKPFGILASRVIGKLYEEKEKGGMIGLERAFNQELKGENGINTFTRISGRWVPEEVVSPQNGNDVMTSIDIEIQDVAENSLKQQLIKHNAHHGVAILMEVETGAIKAIVNLHRKSEGFYIEDYFNYAIGEATEPGSTFKLASMMAVLEDGLINLDDTIDTGNGVIKFYDRTMRDSHYGGFGKITYREVFEKSSNVGISKMIVDNYKSRPKRFIDRLYAMGLNKKHGLEIKGEDEPYIKYPGSDSWSGVSLPWISIGYESELTPLQTLAFYNAVANNGKMMKPYFVTGVYRHGELVKEYQPKVLNPSISSLSTIEKVHDLLVGVVERGTATNLKNNNYKIAGKTGTAQIAKGRDGYKNGGVEYQASFAGYFPADRPKYSCIVVVNGPSNNVYYGNVVAGSVFKQIADRVYATGFDMVQEYARREPGEGVLPYSKGGKKSDLLTVFDKLRVTVDGSEVESEWISTLAQEHKVSFSQKTFKNGLVPNVAGMGAKDAVTLLENAGLNVIVSGRGRVIEQSISPGSRLKRGVRIFIKLG